MPCKRAPLVNPNLNKDGKRLLRVKDALIDANEGTVTLNLNRDVHITTIYGLPTKTLSVTKPMAWYKTPSVAILAH